MPNIKSQKDRVRLSEKQTARNKAQKSALRTELKKARTAIETGAENKNEAVKAAVVALEKAANKGIMHRNTASRRASRLVKYSAVAPVAEAKVVTKKAKDAGEAKEVEAKAAPKKKAEPKAKKQEPKEEAKAKSEEKAADEE